MTASPSVPSFSSVSSKFPRSFGWKLLKKRVPQTTNTMAITTHQTLQYNASFFIPDDVFYYDAELSISDHSSIARPTSWSKGLLSLSSRASDTIATFRRWCGKVLVRKATAKKDDIDVFGPEF